VRVPLDRPTARFGDEVQRTAKCDLGHGLPPVLLVHEDAGDAVVRFAVDRLEVFLAVVDVRELAR
jgi:hypothetical protein